MIRKKILGLVACAAILTGCGQGLQRGMMGDTYVSTARPAISLTVRDMPLMTYGMGTANMDWTGVLGGLPINVWIAVYGTGGLAPLAITAQAQLPSGWIWDSQMSQPFSVDQGAEVFNGQTYEAWTSIVNPKADPFGNLVTTTTVEGTPQLWVARTFAARYNFNQDKIILEYREPLPAGITSLSALPLGQDQFLAGLAQRARKAFEVAGLPAHVANVRSSDSANINWQYVQQNFLGTASRQDLFLRD